MFYYTFIHHFDVSIDTNVSWLRIYHLHLQQGALNNDYTELTLHYYNSIQKLYFQNDFLNFFLKIPIFWYECKVSWLTGFFLSNEKTNQRLVLSRPRLASWKHITFQTFFASVVKESNSECICRVNKNEVHLKKRQTWQSFKCRKL